VVLFGNNPETRMSGGGVTYYLEQARQKSNARMIIIDPRYTDTGAGREDEWIPIRPGTDAALVSALAWVMITENLVDQPFLDKYCVGYDEKTLPASAPANGHYKAYILGQGSDGIAKTPEWASTITGIPASVLFSWRVKLPPPNRPISARAGDRSVMPTVKSPPARSPCSPF
jgi:anaerobic dimethyl sulfoxide reductase subunit A